MWGLRDGDEGGHVMAEQVERLRGVGVGLCEERSGTHDVSTNRQAGCCLSPHGWSVPSRSYKNEVACVR